MLDMGNEVDLHMPHRHGRPGKRIGSSPPSSSKTWKSVTNSRLASLGVPSGLAIPFFVMMMEPGRPAFASTGYSGGGFARPEPPGGPPAPGTITVPLSNLPYRTVL